MAYTLQRKMFKLGGSVAHGGGITANLKNPNRTSMKKGGKVAPIGQVGKGPLYMKGPDGKMREMQNPLALLGMGGAGSAILGSLSRTALSRVLPQFLKRRADPRGIMGFLRGDPITKRLVGKSGGTRELITSIPSTTNAARALRAAQLATAPTGLGITAAGILSAAAPDIPEKAQEKVPLLNLIQGGRDLLLEPTASFNPLGAVTGLLTGKGVTSNVESLTGRDKKAGSKEVPQSDTGKVATRQASEMEKLKNQALERKELYESLMYEPDKLALASNALLSAGTSALRGDELADVVEAGFSPINTEAARRREIESASSQQAITDILNDKATRQAILAEVAKSGDTRAIARVKKFFDASDQGVDDALPMNAKGAMDTAQMRAGTIYADVENATGKLFVAVNESGSEIKQFDTIEEAIEHSQKA